MKKSRQVASLAIRGPGKMLARERKDIAAWLRKTADDLLRSGDGYTEGRFTAGFHYGVRK